MNDKVKEILLNQLQLLQEESEMAREAGDIYDLERSQSLAVLAEAMTKIASVARVC